MVLAVCCEKVWDSFFVSHWGFNCWQLSDNLLYQMMNKAKNISTEYHHTVGIALYSLCVTTLMGPNHWNQSWTKQTIWSPHVLYL